MGKIIAFINQKGGVGKTTTTASVASGMAQSGLKTLAIDLDAQCNLTTSFGITDFKVNTYNTLKGQIELDPIKLDEHLTILPASVDLSAFELEMSAEPGKEYLLKELLEPILDQYDYILLDCSPNLGLVSINALTAADLYIIPLLPHHLSIQGLTKLLEITDKVKKRLNPNLEMGGIVLTQYNKRKVLHRDIAQVVKEHFGQKLLNTVIRENISLAEAPSSGTDIFQYAPKSNGAEDYLILTKEIINL
ncbi:ParA family protein [Marinilabilia salmonicolor]|uniref:ParA family protein n=1 Tax=Marinilabilia salmonicolor TaxID=989 RepID=UPI00029B12B6|nr:ParA family protein [Marinilabilia salmonicolor]